MAPLRDVHSSSSSSVFFGISTRVVSPAVLFEWESANRHSRNYKDAEWRPGGGEFTEDQRSLKVRV